MIPLRYDGDGAFVAPRGFWKRCDKELVIGEVVPWERIEVRSAKSHDHFFAQVKDAWANLPEALAMDFPNFHHLRKHALCKAGYCTITKVVCADNAGAVTAASLMQGMDTYAICDIAGRVVTVYRAQSQSKKAMGAKVFQQSKEDVFAVLSQMIGADITQSEAA